MLKFWDFFTLTMALEEEKEEQERLENQKEDKEDDGSLTPEERQYRTFIDQFASRGPTVQMYGIVLDTMAVCASQITDPYTLLYHTELHPRSVEEVLDQVIGRHGLDGGDANNNKPFTVPNNFVEEKE